MPCLSDPNQNYSSSDHYDFLESGKENMDDFLQNHKDEISLVSKLGKYLQLAPNSAIRATGKFLDSASKAYQGYEGTNTVYDAGRFTAAAGGAAMGGVYGKIIGGTVGVLLAAGLGIGGAVLVPAMAITGGILGGLYAGGVLADLYDSIAGVPNEESYYYDGHLDEVFNDIDQYYPNYRNSQTSSDGPMPSSECGDTEDGLGRNGFNDVMDLPPYSPLVLDMDADGIELISRLDTNAMFDVDADGFRELTGWVAPDDALLAIDLNSNGEIDNINELFGNATTDGFVELTAYDSNNDNKITSADAQYGQLLIWKDENGDGISSADELTTLAANGITEISLNDYLLTSTNAGHTLTTRSTFIMNGEYQDIVDVWFKHSQTNSSYIIPDNFIYDTDVFALPQLRGFGDVPDLWVAMTMDGTLKGLVQSLNDADYSSFSFADFRDDVQDILFRWMGVDGVDPASRGAYIDGRVLEAIEEWTGRAYPPFEGANEPQSEARAYPFIYEWEQFVDAIAARFVVEIPEGALYAAIQDAYAVFNAEDGNVTEQEMADLLEPIFADASADVTAHPLKFIGDAISYNIIGNNLVGDFAAVVAAIESNEPSTTPEKTTYWNDWLPFINSVASSQLLSESEYISALTGTHLDDITSANLFSLRGEEFIIGGSGNDTLRGEHQIGDYMSGYGGDDSFYSGSAAGILGGYDTMVGGEGNDYYRFHNAGVTIIEAPDEGTDWVEAGVSYTLPDNVENMSLVDYGNNILTGIPLANYIDGSGNDLDNIILGNTADNSLFGGLGDDSLVGGLGEDTLNGGGGSDTLKGGVHNDTYIIDNTGVTIIEEANNGYDRVFASISYTLGDELESLTLTGTANINGTGNEKANLIYGNDGDNILRGGAGNDNIRGALVLFGEAGNDTYAYDIGDGEDAIYNAGSTGDKILFGPGITLNDLAFTQSGDYLFIAIDGGGSLLIVNHFGTIARPVETIEFDDNSSISISSQSILDRSHVLTDTHVSGGLLGFGGDDVIEGLLGTDSLNGGDDYDIVSYFLSQAGVEIHLDTQDQSYSYNIGSHAEGDTIVGFEGIEGSQFADKLYGDNGNNTIFGYGGNDTLEGGAGNDTITGGSGIDTLLFNGSFGQDTVSEGEVISINGTTLNGQASYNSGTELYSLNGYTIQNDGGNLLITVSAGNTILLSDWNSTGANYGITLEDTVSGNHAPTVANAIADQDATEDSVFSFQFASNVFEDVDVGDTLTYSATLENGSALPSWLSFNTSTRTFSGTPDTGDVGTIAVKVTADDGNGGTVDDVFDLVVAAATPPGNPITGTNNGETLNGTSGADYITALGGNDDIFAGGGNDTVSSGAGDDYIELGAGNDVILLTLTDSSSASGVDYVGDFAQGQDRLDVSAMGYTDVSEFSVYQDSGYTEIYDSSNGFAIGFDSGTLTLTNADFIFAGGGAPNNDPALANAIADQNATEGSAFSFQFASNTFNDADAGDTLTYSATLSNDAALPSWLAFNASTRTFSGTPLDAHTGAISIKVAASDGHGGTPATDIFMITVADINNAPTVANAIANQNATEDSAFNFQFATNVFADLDAGDTLTYSATLNSGSALPSWLSFSASTRTFSGTPDSGDVGTHVIKVTANDGNGGTVDDVFDLVVQSGGPTFDNTVTGSSGNNTLTGTSGNDLMSGLGGADNINGGSGHDSMDGGTGNDTIYGWTGNDTLIGGDGADELGGDGGDDSIVGGNGNDDMFGWTGNDTLIGGAGGDYLEGGDGIDIFTYTSLSDSTAAQTDYIGDFVHGTDKIDLTGLGFTAIQSGAASGTTLGYTAGGGYTEISNSAGTFFIGFNGNLTFDSGDFIFS